MQCCRALGCLCSALLSLLVTAGSVRTQDYPARPIRLIITSPAGSLVDVLGRLIADELGTRLGQTVVIDNRPGAMTQVGSDALNRAPADGYTLMIGTSEMSMLPALKKGYRYDPLKDFTPIGLVATSWTVFAINPAVPAQTLTDFIAYAKVNPGRVRYGSGGVGGALHIAVELLKLKAGIDLVHVPYRGGAQAATDAISGRAGVHGGCQRACRRRREAEGAGADRPTPPPDVRRCAHHRGARPPGGAHGDLVRLDRAAEHARRDRAQARGRDRGRRATAKLPTEAVRHRV
jgi:tripartite tricarboxylate transporter family receptor